MIEKLLNPPGDVGWLKSNYDKLLHITGTFTAMSVLSGTGSYTSALGAFLIVLTLQVSKTAWNYVDSDRYNPCGDWICNIIGYVLYAMTRWL